MQSNPRSSLIYNSDFFVSVLIDSLQVPVVNLMREIAHSVNTSHFNLPEVLERMQLAIENTVQAAQQVRLPLFSLVLYLFVVTVIR